MASTLGLHHELRVPGGVASEHEKGRFCLQLVERVQYLGRPLWVWTVVEGEGRLRAVERSLADRRASQEMRDELHYRSSAGDAQRQLPVAQSHSGTRRTALGENRSERSAPGKRDTSS